MAAPTPSRSVVRRLATLAAPSAIVLAACSYDWQVGAGGDGGTKPSKDVSCTAGTPCECPAGDTCAMTCTGGSCDVTCREQSTCKIGCTGGSCKVRCSANARCDVGCTGGACTSVCDQGSTCPVSCTGGGCTTTCNSADCSASCPPGTTCPCTGTGCR